MCAYTQPAHREARGTGAATAAGATAGTAGAVTVSRGNFSVIIASPPFRARHWRTAIHAILKIRIVTTGGTLVMKTVFIPPRAHHLTSFHNWTLRGSERRFTLIAPTGSDVSRS